MLIVALLVTLFAGTIGIPVNQVGGLHDQAFVDRINAKQTTWTAEFFERFATPEARQEVLGVSGVTEVPAEFSLDDFDIADDEIPEFFDARQKWPECKSIGHIHDQSTCGSCWAVSSAAAMSDRICIASNGTSKVYISADDLMECSNYCPAGCKGCNPWNAMRTWKQFGLVTGGDHNSKIGCKPYPLPTHNKPMLPGCVRKCRNGYETPYEDDKHYALKQYDVRGNKKWQKDIMTNGPGVVMFTAEGDFFHYKKGVYSHGTGHSPANHAVKILGWGVEDGIPYWLCANSWSSHWGDHGFFKIRRGNNDCGIERNNLIIGLPKIVRK
uniref:Pept_C1 domain-containing protein n=1 Tax=Panagrellus redivivus TaxID=6233 RepID=A0A7E4VV76_PANRE